ncbi:hypothetical protein [Streptomyces sp. Tu6071]|uniref:hypothetical protein n=1 Tax=Streptomyces sp. Tu6071 TaxID=355249 RepID=UPI0005BB7208|nr:hypothetical protein [Streptomyces sp. Tu6071]
MISVEAPKKSFRSKGYRLEREFSWNLAERFPKLDLGEAAEGEKAVLLVYITNPQRIDMARFAADLLKAAQGGYSSALVGAVGFGTSSAVTFSLMPLWMLAENLSDLSTEILERALERKRENG